MTPREAGIQAFYADESTTNTLQGLNAAFDAYEAFIWRPIETAPKDGSEVLGIQCHNGRFSDPGIVSWDEFEQEWWDTDADQYGFPTHWQPLSRSKEA